MGQQAELRNELLSDLRSIMNHVGKMEVGHYSSIKLVRLEEGTGVNRSRISRMIHKLEEAEYVKRGKNIIYIEHPIPEDMTYDSLLLEIQEKKFR